MSHDPYNHWLTNICIDVATNGVNYTSPERTFNIKIRSGKGFGWIVPIIMSYHWKEHIVDQSLLTQFLVLTKDTEFKHSIVLEIAYEQQTSKDA